MANLPYRTSVHNPWTPARPVEIVLERLEQSGCEPRRVGRGWAAKCPAHPDHTPSLAIAEGHDGRALVYCHAGCKPEDVLGALGLSWIDLFPRNVALGRSRCRHLRRGRGLSEGEMWGRFQVLRRALRTELARMIREAERQAWRAGPALFDDAELAARVRRLGWWEWLLERLLGEGTVQEQLEAVLWAREEVAVWARER